MPNFGVVSNILKRLPKRRRYSEFLTVAGDQERSFPPNSLPIDGNLKLGMCVSLLTVFTASCTMLWKTHL